ncbi:MAG: host attachment protein [Inquilinus sp.]|nr:host attachment protein [Inquilinus sp.]
MPAKALRTWIVVADGARARVMLNEGVGKGLSPVPGLEMVDDNPPTREQGSDRPGRTHDRMGPGRHAMEPRADWHRQEKALFAKSIAERLTAELDRDAFDRLVLIAPPAAMGDLRAALDDRAHKLVAGEITKDLTHAGDAEIEDAVGPVLAV